MIKIDLITGPLGNGKTTFIKKYINYLVEHGEKVGVIENDYGGINVDRMLINDFDPSKVQVEMIVGGIGRDCHIRRFKTKLITLSLLGFTRVLVEPSGIYDIDEFFDLLNEDDIYSRYEIGSVFALVKTDLNEQLSCEEKYVLASEVSCAGKIILSFYNGQDINNTLNVLNNYLKEIKANRILTINDLFYKELANLNDGDFKLLELSGYKQTSFEKKYNLENSDFSPMFFLNPKGNLEDIKSTINEIWEDESLGKVIRIKGFIKQGDKWFEINSVDKKVWINEINEGQSLLIIIGENLNMNKLDGYINSDYSSIRTRGNKND